MGVYAVTTPAPGGTVVAGAAVSATDTIPLSALGSYGVILEIINGNAASDSVTISDASVHPVTGRTATAVAATVVNGTAQVFRVWPQQASAAGNVTVTHSVTATVTYKMYPVG